MTFRIDTKQQSEDKIDNSYYKTTTMQCITTTQTLNNIKTTTYAIKAVKQIVTLVLNTTTIITQQQD
jgi:hypothetical protein